MKIEGWIEISEAEHKILPNELRAYFYDAGEDKTYYFKKAQKFPIVFEVDANHDIDIQINGQMDFKRNGEIVFVILDEKIPFLVKAVEKAKEVAKKNDKE